MKRQQNGFNIAVLSIHSFPFGGAPTNRIMAYCKGLTENGIGVDVFVPFPTDNLPVKVSLPDNGECCGINYYHTSGLYRNKYKIFRGLSLLTKYRKIYGYFTSSREIKKKVKSRNYTSLIISTDEIISLKVYRRLAKKIGAKSIFIFDEFPIPIRHKLKSSIPNWKSLLYRIALKKIDAYISISEELKKYFCHFSLKPTIVLPVIVDISRFNATIEGNLKAGKRKYLCYMGNMELSKDDVDNIIKAFGLISEDYKDIDLHLYGNPSSNSKELLTSLIYSLGLEERVYLKGGIPSKNVPGILLNAYILVSSQPNTIRASGGFPTKLGEYLATGVPALLTDVGENTKYVSDGEHVFFAEAQKPEAYANKLRFIIDNYQDALKVAQKGKFFVFDNYSHIRQGKRLVDFLEKLCN